MTLPTKPFGGNGSFDEGKHPRSGNGRFTPTSHSEPEDIRLEPRSYFDDDDDDEGLDESTWPTQDGDGNHQPLVLPDDDEPFPRPNALPELPERPTTKPFFDPADDEELDESTWPTQDGDGNHQPWILPDDDGE